MTAVLSVVLMVVLLAVGTLITYTTLFRSDFDHVRLSPAPEDCGELGGEQPGSDQRDKRIAHHLELVRPGIDLHPRGVEREGKDADREHHGVDIAQGERAG